VTYRLCLVSGLLRSPLFFSRGNWLEKGLLLYMGISQRDLRRHLFTHLLIILA